MRDTLQENKKPPKKKKKLTQALRLNQFQQVGGAPDLLHPPDYHQRFERELGICCWNKSETFLLRLLFRFFCLLSVVFSFLLFPLS
jgi:hypothetical protein